MSFLSGIYGGVFFCLDTITPQNLIFFFIVLDYFVSLKFIKM